MKFIATLIHCLFAFSIYSQSSIEWQKVIGGNKANELLTIRETQDGGYILGGCSSSDSSYDKTESCRGFLDYWIVKVDSSITIQWQRTFGGSDYDIFFNLEQTLDGGYIIGGTSESNISGDKTDSSRSPGYPDYWIIKLNGSGNLVWQKTFGGNNIDFFKTIKTTSDGGFIVGGGSSSLPSGDKTVGSNGRQDIWLFKIDMNGQILWQKNIGGYIDEDVISLEQTTDGGFILGCVSSSNIGGDKTENCFGLFDYWIIKTDSVGSVIWDKTIGGDSLEEIYSIQQTYDGGYILGGKSRSNISGNKTENSKGSADFWIVKLDIIGNIEWQKTLGGDNPDVMQAIREISTGGYLAAGNSYSNISGDKSEARRGGSDCWLVRLDQYGNKMWDKTIGGDDDDEIRSFVIKQDMSIVLGCSSESNLSGDKTLPRKGFSDYWILKLSPLINDIQKISPFLNYHLFPNPFHSILSIDFNKSQRYKIKITNILGKSVLEELFNGTKFTKNLEFLTSGIYFIHIVDEHENSITKKLIKE